MVALVREVTDIPVAIGFGIATPEQAEAMGRKADGVIVGSAIVRMVAADGRNSVEKVGKYVAEMKAAANK
jgi:tryptophan synthase alpha chain